MIRIESEDELRAAFRPRERDEVQLASHMRFPLAARDYLAWNEPSGHRVYLAFPEAMTGRLIGIVFQRTFVASETPAAMCQWCHAVRTGSAVSLLTASAGRDRRVGLYLCTDLNCRENALTPPGINGFRESIDAYERVHRILRRMNDFARANLI